MASTLPTSSGDVERATPAHSAILWRGAGWGSLWGAVCGFFALPVDDLLTFHDDPFSPYTFLFGIYAAPFGMLYGLVAGLISALCFLPAASSRRPASAARFIAATVGPLVVGLISLAAFHPSLTVGGNETSEHVAERVLLFYLFPCTAAAVVGALAGGRLASPIPLWGTTAGTGETET